MQRVTPYLLYADVDRALDWLAKAFGFRAIAGQRMAGADGKAVHAEMERDGAMIMMGCPGKGYKNPKRLGAVTQSLYIRVDDMDKHFARAKKAGAKILEKPADQVYGDRRYGAVDPEGHQWYFAQRIQKKKR